MKNFGVILIIFGGLMVLVALAMDTSVDTGSGTRVNNIGLMQQQSNFLTVGIASVAIGIILALFARKKVRPPVSPATTIYSTEDFKDLQALLAGRGITGISISANDAKTVAAVAEGYPAADAGILAGDRLVMINDELIGNDIRKNALSLAGEKGSTLKVTIRRGEVVHEYQLARK